jgi:nucleoside-diphosphate-sugar epimerase
LTLKWQCAQPAYYEWPEKFPRLQDSILSAAAANGANFIVVDNLYGYGDTHGQPLHEDLPYAAHTRKGRVRAHMAQAVMQAHETGRVRAAIARASDFFGLEDRALSPGLFRAALAGRTIQAMGRVDVPHTWSYVPDFGRALAILGTHASGLGQIWHVPSSPPISQVEFVRLIENEVGRPLKIRGNGKLTLQVLGLFSPLLREMPEMLYEWDQPFVMRDDKFRAAFGMQPTPIKDAIHETVAWFRANPAG